MLKVGDVFSSSNVSNVGQVARLTTVTRLSTFRCSWRNIEDDIAEESVVSSLFDVGVNGVKLIRTRVGEWWIILLQSVKPCLDPLHVFLQQYNLLIYSHLRVFFSLGFLLVDHIIFRKYFSSDVEQKVPCLRVLIKSCPEIIFVEREEVWVSLQR